jgi:hypothetical protein
VLILMRDPNPQEFEGFGVGSGWFGNAELIGLGHGSPLLPCGRCRGLRTKTSAETLCTKGTGSAVP